jgi:hypothetical protein
MNTLIPLALLLIVGIIYVYTQPQKNRLMGILTIVAVVIFLCLIDMKDTFINSKPAPLGYGMGACSNLDLTKSDANKFRWNYDNLKLKANDPASPNCPYGRVPCDAPLISDVTIFSPVGDGIKLTEDLASQSFPTIDGKPGSPKSLFMLAHNMTSPECCPSTFSTDRGCVCLTKEQRNMINGRGGNRQAPDDY